MDTPIQYFLILFMLLYLGSCNLINNLENETIQIDFKQVSADSLGFINPSTDMQRIVTKESFLEQIKKYPRNFKKILTYQFDAQGNRRLSELFVTDSIFRKKERGKCSKAQIDFMVKHSKVQSYDCIISACEVENEEGEKFFIFDSNNDEDLTNDSLMAYKDYKSRFVAHSQNSSYKMAESLVEVEIFDGEMISKENLLLSFVKNNSRNGEINFLSNRMINAGFVNFNGTQYSSIILNRPPNVNYSRYDFLWIDLNQNNIYDSDADFYQQMISPFTLFGSSYRVCDINVFGKSIQIEKLNFREYPPIAVGMLAPDFKFTLNDSSESQLSNYKGKYVLLDFWMCNPFYCNSISLELSKKYKDYNNLQIVSCAYDSVSFDAFRQTHTKGDDNRLFLSGLEIEKVRNLYQQTSSKKLILIDPDLKIKSIEKFTSNKTAKLLSELLTN